MNKTVTTRKLSVIVLCVSLFSLLTEEIKACNDDICTTAVTVERYTVLGPTTLKSEQGWLHCDGTYQVITSSVDTYSESFVSQYLPVPAKQCVN